MNMFEMFSTGGKLLNNGTVKNFDTLDWVKHPSFEGVELKHIVAADDTRGSFSYHLVRIAPGKSIGMHSHDTQIETHEVISGKGACITSGAILPYDAGTIAILPKKQAHEVKADAEGLYLFAKFIPALC